MLINYREIGINKQLRANYNNYKKSQLDRACEALRQAINNPFNINYYEYKLALIKKGL